MNFTSGLYILLLPAAVLGCRLFQGRLRQLFLLGFGWFFYWQNGPTAFFVLLFVTIVSYFAGLCMDHAGKPGKRMIWLTAAYVMILGILFVFKYLDFGMTILFSLTGREGQKISVLLPAGISFYTFQSLSYCLEVYRKKYPAEKDFFLYALYVSFFPQVVAGPIEKPEDLLIQLKGNIRAGRKDMESGFFLLLRGYFKKLVIADFAAPFVDALFSGSFGKNGPVTAAAAVLFYLQIYADFSGYSDIACGTARMMGIRLSVNFRRPYLAQSMHSFWRRWHITLTRWFTDSIYIPLGGNRHGIARQCLLTTLVFSLSGLWHGAAWHFIFWGMLHGSFMVMELLWENYRQLHKEKSFHEALPDHLEPSVRKNPGFFSEKRRAAGSILTFALVSVSWLFFRASSMDDAFRMLAALPSGWTKLPGMLINLCADNPPVMIRFLLLPGILYFLDQVYLPDDTDVQESERIVCIRVVLSCILVWTAFCAWLAIAARGEPNAFIYFQF